MSSTAPPLAPQLSINYTCHGNGMPSSSPPFTYQPYPNSNSSLFGLPPTISSKTSTSSQFSTNNSTSPFAPNSGAYTSTTNYSHPFPPMSNGPYPPNAFQPSGSATSLPKSYVNSVDEYLRIVEISLKSIRSLWRSRTSIQHQSPNTSPMMTSTHPASAHQNDPTVSPSKRRFSAHESGSSQTTNASNNPQELLHDSEMINYLIWNCCVMLSKLFISPQPWHFSAFAAHPSFSSYIPFIVAQSMNVSQPTTPAAMPRSSFGSTQSLFASSTIDIPPYSPCSGISGVDGVDCQSSTNSIPPSPSPSSSPVTPTAPLSPSQQSFPPNYSTALPPTTLTFSHPSASHSQTAEHFTFGNNSPPQSSRAPVTLAYLPDLAEHESSIRLEHDDEEFRGRSRSTHSSSAQPLPSQGSRTYSSAMPTSPVSPVSPPPISPSLQSQLPIQRLTRSHSTSLFPTTNSSAPLPSRSSQKLLSSEIVKAHFCSLFSSPSHPYGYALLTFLNHMQDERGDKMRKWVQEELERRRAHRLDKSGRTSCDTNENQGKFFVFESVDKELHEIQSAYVSRHLQTLRSFIKFYNRLIISSYPALGTTIFTKKIMLNTLQSFVFDSSSKTMLTLYAQCFEREDEWMWNRVREIQQYCNHPTELAVDLESPPEQLPNIFNDTSVRFSQTIELLRSMFAVECIRDKWTILVSVCRMAAVERNSTTSAKRLPLDALPPISSVILPETNSSYMACSDDIITTLSFCLAYIIKFDDIGSSAASSISPLSSPRSITTTRDRRSSSNATNGHLSPKVYRMYSQMRLMSEWVNERSLMGEKGFCITTWTCSMEYLAYTSLPMLLNTFLTI